jgi:hypothetical protein
VAWTENKELTLSRVRAGTEDDKISDDCCGDCTNGWGRLVTALSEETLLALRCAIHASEEVNLDAVIYIESPPDIGLIGASRKD